MQSSRDGSKKTNMEGLSLLAQMFDQLSRKQKENALRGDLFNASGAPDYKPTTPSEAAEEAKLNVEKVGPRVYNLHCEEDVVQLYVFGCQGEDNPDQKKVAALMEKIAADKKPTVAIILGDNVYDDGINRPDSPALQSQFYDIYCNPALKKTKNLPFFLALGNHDGKRHSWEEFYQKFRVGETGRPIELNEVAHTYLPHATDPEGLTYKPALFAQENLNATYLPKWNMPYFHYSLVMGNMQVFVLNSNSYVSDYLEYIKDPDGCDPNNQAKWYATEFAKAKAAGRSVMVAQHHPLFTCGKRAYPSKGDAKLYLTQDELKAINKHLGKKLDNKLYNPMLLEVFQKQGVVPDTIFAAHDHAMYYHNSLNNHEAPDQVCQVIAGGGGGKLQQREFFSRQDDLGAYIKHNGFVRVSFDKNDPQLIDFDFYSINGFHLSFDNQSSKPIRHVNNGSVEDLRSVILDVCNKHILQLSHKQASEHDHGFFGGLANKVTKIVNFTPSDDVQGLHDIMNYFNQASLSSTFEVVLSQFHGYLNKLHNHSEGSLQHNLEAALSGCTFGDKPYADWCAELSSSQFAFGS